jgi:hypothetical protein
MVVPNLLQVSNFVKSFVVKDFSHIAQFKMVTGLFIYLKDIHVILFSIYCFENQLVYIHYHGDASSRLLK